VDQRPRLFDVKIFANDADHPGGWGTILVGSMRFGGAPVDVNQLDLDNNGAADYPADTRRFTSAFFILDVTNPEKPPVLLGEMTMNGAEVDLGYSTAMPTLVPMKEGNVYKWYLVMGSGPTMVKGESSMNGKVAVMPLDLLTAAPASPFRIPNAAPAAASNYVGSWIAPTANSFASDMITVDFEMKEDYRADVVYFGSVEGTFATSWGGKLYRLVTRKLDALGNQVTSTPDEWYINTLIDVGDPITAAPTVGWDGMNYWVLFGTGRFFHSMEKTDVNQQAYYGIKEPLDCSSEFTWAEVEKVGVPDSLPGAQGLLQVDKILIQPTSTSAADIVCKDADAACLALVAGGVTTFSALEEYISGSGCLAVDPTGTDGWFREFPYDKERNLGQAALLGGLVTFTTFKPFDDPCLPEGYSYLYGIYLKTGTSYYQPVFENIVGTDGLDIDGTIIDIVPIGRGMSTTPNLHVGKSEGSKAFIQTSTGAIIEVPQVNLPISAVKTGRANWIELTD
jgi:type IV pilus assembly protein PilY1